MGIDIEWRMLQGAPFSKWEEAVGEDPRIEEEFDGDFNWFLQEGLDLSRISPFYDADESYCIYGIYLEGGEGSVAVDLEQLNKNAKEAYAQLLEKYNIETETIISQHVW